MHSKTKNVIAVLALILTGVLIAVLKTVDVAPIGPEGTSIGLSHLNQSFHEWTGVNEGILGLSEFGGYLAIATALVFAMIGLVQLIKRRSLRKIDRALLLTAGLYAMVVVLYVLFDVAVVNYRPVIMPGDAHVEPSFPSTHAMMGCVFMGSAYLLVPYYVKADATVTILRLLSVVNMFLVVGGRLFSGVHWLTDIIGGVLISIALLCFYSALLDEQAEAEPEQENN